MTTTCKINLLIVYILCGCSLAAGRNLPVARDGEPVVGKGIFGGKCVYGNDESLSDHAPMIWRKQKIGTWNITTRVSHKQIRTVKGVFMGHKFKTDDKGVLIDNAGKPVLAGHSSEADISSRTTVTNRFYRIRLKSIAKKIKQLFTRYGLKYFATQEIPYRGQKDVDGKYVQQEFANELGPDLVIHYPAAKKLLPGDASDKSIDAAMITRANASIVSPVIDEKNRMQSYCDRQEMTCAISVHLLSAENEVEVRKRCEDIVRMVESLKKRGYRDIAVTGDFNMSADRMARFCKPVPGFNPAIKTSKTRAQSCSTNRGDSSPDNIDLLLQF